MPKAESRKSKGSRTLRGFIAGEEPDEENFFPFSASLRVFGDSVPFEELTQRLGVQATHAHRKAERRGSKTPRYREDGWIYQSSLSKTEPLERHIEALWQIVRPEIDYLKTLKQRYKVNVFCGYRSNCDTAGFKVSYKCLELFTALEVPFGVSVVIS